MAAPQSRAEETPECGTAQTGLAHLPQLPAALQLSKTKCLQGKAGKINAQQQKIEWIPLEVSGAEIQGSEWEFLKTTLS